MDETAHELGRLAGTIEQLVVAQKRFCEENTSQHAEIFGRLNTHSPCAGLMETQRRLSMVEQAMLTCKSFSERAEDLRTEKDDSWTAVAGKLAVSAPIAVVLLYVVYRMFEKWNG